MLNGVACVWNEEDIIEASVKHAFAQGCSNVFIIDNGSTDKTVKRAEKAGAILAASFESKFFDERQKIAYLNATVKYYNSVFQKDSVWWLYFDADEFPNINCGLPLSCFLAQLNPAIRALHGRMYDHVPTHSPYMLEGHHPVDFMPVCAEPNGSKIPVVRYDFGQPHLFSAGGAHELGTNGETLLLAKDIVDIHHFPIRKPEYTLSKLKRLLYKTDDGTSRADWYIRRSKLLSNTAQTQYHNKYEMLQKHYIVNYHGALKTRTLNYDFKHIKRWYNTDTVMLEATDNDFDSAVCQGIFYFFNQDYELALCKFNDAIGLCTSEELNIWLTLKIAECFAVSDPEAACLLLQKIYQSSQYDLCSYIDAHLHPVLAGQKLSCTKQTVNEINIRLESYCGEFAIAPDMMLQDMDRLTDKIATNHQQGRQPVVSASKS